MSKALRFSLGQFIARRPYLFALLLTSRNRAFRLAERRMFFAAAITTLLAVVAGAVLAIHFLGGQKINEWLAYVDAHSIWLAIIAALQTATTVTRRRKQLRAALRDSWLTATPRSALTVRSSLIFGVMWVPLVQLAIVVALLLILEHAGRGDAVTLHRLMLIVGGSFACGAVLGSLVPLKQRRNDRPGSRYVPGTKSTTHSPATASLTALSRWPIAAALAWATPDTVRWPLMAAMLAVMSGSSIIGGLSVVGFWMLIVYMIAVCSSTLRVANEAATWLRVTPLSFRRFATAIGVRSFVHQLVATALIAAFLAFDKLTALQAVLFVAPWMAFVMVAYSTGIAHCFYNRRGARFGIALSAVSIAVAEALQRGAAVPLALLICAWQLRMSARVADRREELLADV